jgi:hypothetical protein
MNKIKVELTEDQISAIIAGLTFNMYTEAGKGGGQLDQYEKAHNAFSKRLINTLHKARVS